MTLQRVDDTAAEAPRIAGHVAFTLAPERQQLIGVTDAPAAVRPLVRELRVAATVAEDVGLYEALIEYREALRTRGALRATTVRESVTSGDALVRAAGLKLRRQGLGDRELAALGDLDPTSLILPGARVWIYAQVFEEDAPLLGPGMALHVDVPSQPGRTLPSTIFSVDPTVTSDTRTVRVRALVSTPDASLRPGTFVTATFEIPLGDRLAIPRTAVLDTGLRRLVFITEGTRFEPRDVTLGPTAGDVVAVTNGLAAGDRVVTSANFLIDSESRLKAAVAAFGAAPAHQH
jgi:multidrug efflux pump subunit AcrA (membrane-fusion protein)